MTPTQSPTLASQATAELPEPAFSLMYSNMEEAFTADQMSAHYLAGYEAGRASRAQSEWREIHSAPRDGKPILGWCVHSADSYYVENVGCLTDYGARVEGLSHVEDGPHVLVWGESYEVSDGWENPSFTMPAGWELSHDCEVMANPTHWMPLPSAPATLGETK